MAENKYSRIRLVIYNLYTKLWITDSIRGKYLVYFRKTSSFERDIWKCDCRSSFFRNLVLSYLMHTICYMPYTVYDIPYILRTSTSKTWTNSEWYETNRKSLRMNRFTDKRLFSTFCCHFLVIKMIKCIRIVNLIVIHAVRNRGSNSLFYWTVTFVEAHSIILVFMTSTLASYRWRYSVKQFLVLY